MRHTNPHARIAPSAGSTGTLFIAVGLVILTAGTWIPAMPVVTAMAILSLGATNVTVAHFRASPAVASIVLLHAATYAVLYGLFIGATLHAATGASTSGFGAWTALDLAASTFPMAIALRRIGRGLRQQFESRR